MKYEGYYEYRPCPSTGSARHFWVVVGPLAGVHLWVEVGNGFPFGGFETHYRNPPKYMADDSPSHDNCWVLKCPCWHDGTSLWATEYWIPMWLNHPNDHEFMLVQIDRELQKIHEDIAANSQ